MTPITRADLMAMESRIMDAISNMIRKPTNCDTLNFVEAMEFLGKGRSTLRKMVAAGEIASIKDGKSVKFLKKDIDCYIMSHRRISYAEAQRTRAGHI